MGEPSHPSYLVNGCRRPAGVARAVRAAIVVPSLFALALFVIKQPQLAGLAVFATFARLVMVKYDIAGRTRCAEATTLTPLGAIAVSLGALASATVWLPVCGAAVAGFLTEFVAVTRGRVAVICTALLLSFKLAVAMPVSAGSVLPYLVGWLLAGLVAQPALLLIWVQPQTAEVVEKGQASRISLSNLIGRTGPVTWIGNPASTVMAMGLAVLLTRLLKIGSRLLGCPQRVSCHQCPGDIGDSHVLARTGRHPDQVLSGVSLVAIVGAHQLW
jgi:hypothetical protein